MVKLGFGMTAWEIHEMAMKDLEKCETSIDDSIVQRNIPTLEQARTYVDCEYKLNCYWRRKYPEGIIPISYEESEELFKRKMEYDVMALDMRDVIFEEDGKKGLRRVTGEIVVPPLFDDFPERYSYITQIDDNISAIPVVIGKKYALCLMDGKGTLATDIKYDKMYMLFFASNNYYVVECYNKKGLIKGNGEEIVPCEMDEFYEQIDTDGIIPYRQGEKWGLLHFGVTTGIIFDDIIIESECYARGKIGEEWFFIDGYGKPTKKENEAWFGSWIDADR